MEQEWDLLCFLASGDEDAARTALALRSADGQAPVPTRTPLTPKAGMLVRLAALIALDASTTSLHWAVERACCAGAAADEIVGVLITVGADVGAPRIVSCAPRLALAIGYDMEIEGWDGE